MTLAAVLGVTKLFAALAFFGVLLALGAAYRVLARRLESERAEAVLEAEFQRLDSQTREGVEHSSVRSSSAT